MRPIPCMPEHVVAGKLHVWRVLPGCVLLLAPFLRHPRGVRSLLQSHTERSSWTSVEWLSHNLDRDSLFAPQLAASVSTGYSLLRVCTFGSSAWPADRSTFFCSLLTTTAALPTSLSELLHDPRSVLFR